MNFQCSREWWCLAWWLPRSGRAREKRATHPSETQWRWVWLIWSHDHSHDFLLHPSHSCPCCAEGPLVRWEAWCVQYRLPCQRCRLLRLLVVCQSLWARRTETLRQYHCKVGTLCRKSVVRISRIGQDLEFIDLKSFYSSQWFGCHYIIWSRGQLQKSSCCELIV